MPVEHAGGSCWVGERSRQTMPGDLTKLLALRSCSGLDLLPPSELIDRAVRV
jgi:hypothetical protein